VKTAIVAKTRKQQFFRVKNQARGFTNH